MAEYTIELYKIDEPVKLTRVVSGPGGIGLHEQIFPSAFAAFTWIMGDVCPPGDDAITIEHTDTPVLSDDNIQRCFLASMYCGLASRNPWKCAVTSPSEKPCSYRGRCRRLVEE